MKQDLVSKEDFGTLLCNLPWGLGTAQCPELLSKVILCKDEAII